jgi:hypothetical protein
MLIFVVARTRLDRYEELRHQFQDWRDVRIVLDRREGERRALHRAFSGVDLRRVERRHGHNVESYFKLGWAVIDADELAW